MEYYILKGGKKIGPLDETQIKETGIDSETLVWKQGMDDWAKAGDTEELTDLLQELPPTPPSQPVPRFWMKRCVLTTLLCPPLGIIGVLNSIKAEEYYHRKMYALAERRAEDARKWALWGLCIFSFVSLMILSMAVALIVFKIILL